MSKNSNINIEKSGSVPISFDAEKKSVIQNRFKNVFEFLKAYNDLRTPVVSDISQQISTVWLSDLPKHPSIRLNEYIANSKQDLKEDGSQENDVVLEITRPTMTRCPKAPDILSDWLIPGWTKIDEKLDIIKSRNITTKEGETLAEKFDDSDERKAALKVWVKKREVWVENEKPTWEAVKFFEKIYELYGHMEREGERVELLVGDGLLECYDESSKRFRHPVLLQRLELEFRPEKKQPQFIVRRREQPPELCLDFLRTLPNTDARQLVKCTDELRKMEFDPLGQEDTTGFIRRLIQGLFPSGGRYIERDQQRSSEDITIERNPVIFMRQRHAGLGHAIDLILQDITNRIKKGEDFSVAMMQILGIDDKRVVLNEEEAEASTFGNEDSEILLSKPANQEQLQIAKQLERRGTVLVQGPPGTGKTHTIANLIGHLLSQGKRVLVTAQSPKALRILRREIVNDIQSLCVSVLQKEKQNIEELQQSVRDINVKLSQDEKHLEKTTIQIREERTKILNELKQLRQKLFEAREDEIREVVFGGIGIRPIEAAKKIHDREPIDSWIPGPVSLGSGLPLTHSEVSQLYQTNAISINDEKELNSNRPDISNMPSVAGFAKLIHDLNQLKKQDSTFGKEYWNDNASFNTDADFEKLISLSGKTIEFFKDSASWQLDAVQAGCDGEISKKTWISLIDFINQSWKEIQESNSLIMEYGPSVMDLRPAHVTLPIINEIVNYVQKGNSLGTLTRITKHTWFQFLEKVQIGGKKINLKKKEHLLSVRAYLHVINLRKDLCDRWERQMIKGGAPTIDELGEKPEQVCRQFVAKISDSLEWHDKVWLPLELELNKMGFNWSAYFDKTKPEIGENSQLIRLKASVTGDFGNILKSRLSMLCLRDIENKLVSYKEKINVETENDAVSTRELRQALAETDSKLYSHAYTELARLKSLDPDLKLRNMLLKKIATCAPAWATAIQAHSLKHGSIQAPGNPESAWEWRQLHDELERRASISLEHLQECIESLNRQLLEVTSKLVEKQTWLNQLRIVKPEERRALGAYATLQAKKTKGGKGKKDETIKEAVRREMETAKGAVPVWIMPLNEVIENFNPLNTRFDVVIIDEASQADPLAMFALYLGKQAIVVGDDEQVTPTTPGIEAEEILKLIRTYLGDIPYKEFYDGETSIYSFAQTVFGNVVRLVEHFRCAPDIIAFSNALSYGGDIKPLREEASIPLHPNTIPYRVSGVISDDKINEIEAQAVASLICAAVEQSEFKKKTFGVISLLGDQQQPSKIETILRTKLSADVYQQREILCGNPTHFQGDQRDVIFMSMVESPAGGPLNLRDADANRKLYKKRYNVAASRAKDQMWLVYSLNHETDLKPGDIRKRLIEHMIDPKAWQREKDELIGKTESPFEERVMSYLLERGFKVHPQYQVGAYRIDIVVSGGGKRVGIECDGEQWHGPEKLQEDMERQAILERLGWKFIRIRGSVFFRDADRAMVKVLNRLEEIGITPERVTSVIPEVNNNEVIDRVRCRAQELQNEWKIQPEIEEAI